ncbi:hypothetical protein BOX15_Mlig029757g2, partial [Macrostomum lignano]
LRITNRDGSRKRLVKPSSFNQLLEQGCAKLELETTCEIQVVTADGFVVDDDDFLPDLAASKTELIFLRQGEAWAPPAPAASNVATLPSNDASGSETAGDTAPDDQTAAASTSAASAEGSKPWPLLYRLPRMPDLDEALQDLRRNPKRGEDFKMKATFVNTFLKYTINDIFRNYKSMSNPYLSAGEIRDVCNAIISTYPGLSDTSPDGRQFWRVKITRRLKELRSKILPQCSSPIVLNSREKFGRKRVPLDAAEKRANIEAAVVADDGGDSEEDVDPVKEPEEKRLLLDQSDACSIAKSVYLGSCEIDEVPPRHEEARKSLNQSFNLMQINDVLEAMKDLFAVRILRCQELTIQEQVNLYKPLVLCPVILQEAYLMIDTYRSNAKTDYILPESPSDIGKNIRTALLQRVWPKRITMKNYKMCQPFLVDTDDDEKKIAAAFCLLLGRTGCNPSVVFSPELPIHIIQQGDVWRGVAINGAELLFDSPGDIVVCFTACFVAFNLQHIPCIESFLEAIEVLSKLRKRSAVSRRPAKTLLDALG